MLMVYNHKFEVKPEVIADAVSTEIKRWFRKWQFSLTLCTENVLTYLGGWVVQKKPKHPYVI